MAQPNSPSPPPTLHPVTAEDLPALHRLWQLYTHDMSEFVGSVPRPDGTFKTDRVDEYVRDPGCVVSLVRAADTPVGFVTVGGVHRDPKTIGDFFVVRSVRRRGVGSGIALSVFRRFPGLWEIAFQDDNAGAGRMWRDLAAEVSDGRWHEERRPVPGKPHVPPDVWLTFSVSV